MKKLILIPYEKYARLFSPSEERLERLEPMDTKKENKLSDQDILSLLPEKLRDKGKQFLHFLKTEPSIDWDEKGRVIIDGNILNFSHITDFLKDTLQPGKPVEPVEHLESWYAKLSDSVPLSLVEPVMKPVVEPVVEPVVKPVQAQGASQEENSQPIIIPPGIPDKSPKKVNFKIKWQTLSI